MLLVVGTIAVSQSIADSRGIFGCAKVELTEGPAYIYCFCCAELTLRFKDGEDHVAPKLRDGHNTYQKTASTVNHGRVLPT